MNTTTSRLAAALALPLMLSAGGCVVYWEAPLESETRYITENAQPHSALEVRTANGAVTVTRADVLDMEITATVKARSIERLDSTSIAIDYTDEVVSVYPIWPGGGRKNNESCSFEILVPGAEGVRVDTSNGAVRLTGLGGFAEIDTSNGRVVVNDHDGDVWADTSNGRVEMNSVYGSAEVDTSNGRITLIDMAGPVTASSSNGSIRVELTPDNPGPAVIDTSNGAIDLAVGPAFGGNLKLRTSNGSLNVNEMLDGRDIYLSELGKRSATLRFEDAMGDSYAERSSKVVTSNGSITLRCIGMSGGAGL